jgi:putative membrane protein
LQETECVTSEVFVSYCGPAPAPADFLAAWNFDPPLLIGLAMFAALVGRRPTAAGWAAFGLMVLVFVSPLCALTAALFSARVVHHVILIAGIAPLLVLAFPPRDAGRLPLAFLILVHAVVVWAWHAPGAYSWALVTVPGYWLMQATLLGTAWALWRAVLMAPDRPVAGLTALISTVLQMGMLGALLTFAPEPLYAVHFATTGAWGLSPLHDQQLGGLIMWAPALLPYLAAAILAGRRILVMDMARR